MSLRCLVLCCVTMLVSADTDHVSSVKSLLRSRHRRRADKHIAAAPPPGLYQSAPPTYSPLPPKDNAVDLHNKEFCVDVSTYQPVLWVERDGQECKTSWVKQCEDKTENVCIDVTETVCEVS